MAFSIWTLMRKLSKSPSPGGLPMPVGTCAHSAVVPKHSALNHVSWDRLSEVQAQSIGPVCMRISQHRKKG